MLNSRLKWVVLLVVLFHIVLACSKREEETPAERPRAETPAEQKSAITGQSQGEPATEEASRAGEVTEAVSETERPAEESGTETAASNGQGEDIYQQTCSSCHATGVAGAPKVGDTEAWSSLIAKGEEQLVQSAVNGIGAMPPKGGNPSLSEEEITAAVNYMIDQSR